MLMESRVGNSGNGDGNGKKSQRKPFIPSWTVPTTVGETNPNFEGLLAPGEEWRICPYNKSHLYLNTREFYHLSGCRRACLQNEKRGKGKVDISVCRYNWKHHIPTVDKEQHEKTCDGQYTMYLYLVDRHMREYISKLTTEDRPDDLLKKKSRKKPPVLEPPPEDTMSAVLDVKDGSRKPAGAKSKTFGRAIHCLSKTLGSTSLVSGGRGSGFRHSGETSDESNMAGLPRPGRYQGSSTTSKSCTSAKR